MLCSLPTPIVFQQERSCIKHKLDKKTKQQDNIFVNWLTEIKLKVKAGTYNTFSRAKLVVTWIVPMCVTTTLSPLGHWTKDKMELVVLVNNLIEWTIWFVAPVLRTQVCLPKIVLLAGFVAKMECSIFKQTKSWKEAQRLPEIAELAMAITSLKLLEVEAWEFNRENKCWYCSEVKVKGLF